MASTINDELTMLLNKEYTSLALTELLQGLDGVSSSAAHDTIPDDGSAFLPAAQFSPSQYCINRILSYASTASPTVD